MSDQPDLQVVSAEHLRTLYDITKTMNSTLDFDEVLNVVMDTIMQVTGAQRGYLMIEQDGTLEVRVARGMDGERLAETTAYSTTIVNQVVQTSQALLTNNAQFDTRYKPGESIIMRGLRAILCAPMVVKGQLIGVVYVDTALRAGNFTEAHLQLLNAVAGQAGIAIVNARLYRVAVEKGRLERELQMAREIQESLLPRRLPTLAGYQVAAGWQSAREVAGDFYDVFRLPNGSLALVIADVSDKGAPAALFMASARSMIRSHAFTGLSPLETLDRTNRLILADTENGMFVTAYMSELRADGSSVHVNAGHNQPLLYRSADQRLVFMPRGGRAIGWFEDNPMKAVELRLQPGDTLVYYTDGVTDAENVEGEEFGAERLAQAVMEGIGMTAQGTLDHILAQVNAFCKGAAPFDDMTICVVKYTGSSTV